MQRRTHRADAVPYERRFRILYHNTRTPINEPPNTIDIQSRSAKAGIRVTASTTTKISTMYLKDRIPKYPFKCSNHSLALSPAPNYYSAALRERVRRKERVVRATSRCSPPTTSLG